MLCPHVAGTRWCTLWPTLPRAQGSAPDVQSQKNIASYLGLACVHPVQMWGKFRFVSGLSHALDVVCKVCWVSLQLPTAASCSSWVNPLIGHPGMWFYVIIFTLSKIYYRNYDCLLLDLLGIWALWKLIKIFLNYRSVWSHPWPWCYLEAGLNFRL